MCFFKILVIIFCAKVFQCKSQNIFHGSQSSLQKLLELESLLAKAVGEYAKNLQVKTETAKNYLKEYEASRKTEILENPLESFKLIRRFVVDLQELEKQVGRDDERRSSGFLRTLENIRKGKVLPQQKDLDVATEGIIRVHDAYDLDAFEFASGNFSGHITNSSLTASDCYRIGSYALDAGIFTRALQWLERSAFLTKTEEYKQVKVKRQLQKAIIQHNEAYKGGRNPYVFQQPVHLDLAEVGKKRFTLQLQTQLASDKQTAKAKLYNTESSFEDLTNFAALCRGEQLQMPQMTKDLHCYHYINFNSLNLLSPLKVELLHKSPQVIQIHDLLSPSILQNLRAAASSESLSRSKVHGQGSRVQKLVSASRTSSSAWIRDQDHPEIMRYLRQRLYPRLGALLELDFDALGAMEELQLASYGPTGHFNPHLDNILTEEIAPSMDAEERSKGDRIATLMFYLSEVKGGRSAFPRIGLAAVPLAGSALIWFNSKRNGDVEALSLHGGCPLLYGRKLIANQWIRANSQMFARKCVKSKNL